eukprot:TRINITY_DN2785_c0_g2_i1.p1 TRINITY_DN2785_c0_g2~~TRINITY_DN2785_c0_g2_i1.p1  ORF type:complete len:491 (-),score=29.62 TRINITY_DN2785_c0_g2_i1:354-1826(-)
MLALPHSSSCRQNYCTFGKHNKLQFRIERVCCLKISRRQKNYNQRLRCNCQDQKMFYDEGDKDKQFKAFPGFVKGPEPTGQPKDSISNDNQANSIDYRAAVLASNHNLFIKDPQRSYLKQNMVLAETNFRSKHRLARLISKLLHNRQYSTPDGNLKELPCYLLKALLQYHPSVEEKRLYDIVNIFVALPPAPYTQYPACFWVERSDGSTEDVSYRKCIMSRYTPLGTFIRASKCQLVSFYKEYIDSLFNSGNPVYCSKTGVQIHNKKDCIVSCKDEPFEYIISQFVQRHRIDVSSVQYVIKMGQKNKRIILISSPGLRVSLERYFRDNVRLCLVHKWYFVKYYNQILLYSTLTNFATLKQIDEWEQLGSLRIPYMRRDTHLQERGTYKQRKQQTNYQKNQRYGRNKSSKQFSNQENKEDEGQPRKEDWGEIIREHSLESLKQQNQDIKKQQTRSQDHLGIDLQWDGLGAKETVSPWKGLDEDQPREEDFT